MKSHQNKHDKAMEKKEYLSTEEVAEILRLRPQTLRAALCRTGSYYGIRPIKTPNRLLLWPKDEVLRLIGE